MAIETMARPEVAATPVAAPPGDQCPPPPVRVPRLIVLACVAILALIGVYDIRAHTPANILDLPAVDSARPALNATLPQGWAFFTRSPREENLRAYPLTAQGRGEHVQTAYSEPGNAFGLDRAVRSQGTELGLIQAAVPVDAWVECEGARTECLEQAASARGSELPSVDNPVFRTTVCGPVILSMERAGVWAYKDLVEDSVRVARYAVVEVSCSSNG